MPDPRPADPCPHGARPPGEPSRLDRPAPARQALARSLERLCAGTAVLLATTLVPRRVARVDGHTRDDRTWNDGDRHARATRRRARSREAGAFLDAAQASVQLRSDLLNRSDERS